MHSVIHDSDYMDMEIGMAYRFLNNRSILTEMHAHNYYEYFIITSGEICHIVNGKTTLLRAGDAVFIRPDDCHKYRIAEAGECDMINVSFRTLHFDNAVRFFDSDLTARLLEGKEPPKITLTPAQISSLKKKHTMLNVSPSKKSLVIQLKTLLIDVLMYFLTDYEQQNLHSENFLLSVLAMMNTPENIEEGVPALVRISGFSHGHLCRLMKQEMGITPVKYVTNLRLQYAANLLTSTTKDILSISMELGFTSLSHFITIFKQKYGISPSKYRSAYSNIHIWK